MALEHICSRQQLVLVRQLCSSLQQVWAHASTTQPADLQARPGDTSGTTSTSTSRSYSSTSTCESGHDIHSWWNPPCLSPGAAPLQSRQRWVQGDSTLTRSLHHHYSLQRQLRLCSSQAQTQHEEHGDEEQQSSHPSRDVAARLKQQILEHALAEVKEHGWSTAALEQAAKKLGLSPAVTGILAR